MHYFSESDLLKISNYVDWLILDNTLIGAPRTSPSLFNKKNMIYVESLTKNYHFGESSGISAGIISYPIGINSKIEESISLSGCYLQINDLINLPLELYMSGSKNISKITGNAHLFYKKLYQKQIFIPNKLKIKKNKFPPILFLDLKKNENIKKFMKITGLESRGSFGHSKSFILPLGLMWKDVSEGLIRLSFGRENINFLIKKTNKFLKKCPGSSVG